MGPSEQEDYVVVEPEPNIYNPTASQPPVWQPAPHDILLMFQQLEASQVLPLKWVCPGRRLPDKEPPEQPMDFTSDGEEEDDGKEEEKRAPEPSEFDFDDTASEASTKVKMTPRTPVSAQARRPEKKVARMDNVLNSIKRQQKAEREARKSQARSLGASPFRGGTPVRMSALSPASSPRLPAATGSPGPSSPRLAAPTASPSSRWSGEGGGGRAVAGEGVSATSGRPGASPSAVAPVTTGTPMDTSSAPASTDMAGGAGEGGGGKEPASDVAHGMEQEVADTSKPV